MQPPGPRSPSSRLAPLVALIATVRVTVAADPAPDIASAPTQVVRITAPGSIRTFEPQPDVVREAVRLGITTLTGEPDAAPAWRSMFRPEDRVGIKVVSHPGPIAGTRIPVVAAVVEGLLSAGLPPAHVTVWDRRLQDLTAAGWDTLRERFGIRLAGAVNAGYEPDAFYASSLIGTPVWGDLEFGRTGPEVGRRSHASVLLTREFTKIILVSPLLNHQKTGLTGHLYSLAVGAVDNTLRFRQSAVHLEVAVPEICALDPLRGKVTLAITDALLRQYQGENDALLHYTDSTEELWFGHDPVALDALGRESLDKARGDAGLEAVPTGRQLVRNAELLELGVGRTSRITILRASLPPR